MLFPRPPGAPIDEHRRTRQRLAELSRDRRCHRHAVLPHAEAVLHDLRTQKVDYIANNLSKRAIGDDSALEDMLSDDVSEVNIGPYEKLNWDGQKIRSLSTVLRDANGRPLAVLCINLNISLFENAQGGIGPVPVAKQADPTAGRAVSR